MRVTLRGLTAALAIAVAATAAPVEAQRLTFDDRTAGQPVTPLDATYGGLEFGNIFVGSDADLGTGAGAVSGTQFAYVGNNSIGYGEIYNPAGTFNAFTGWLGYRSTLPLSGDLFVTLVGSSPDGTREHSAIFAVSETMRWIEFRTPLAVDAFYLETAALDARPEGVVLALDDVSVSTVPEPGTVVLLGTGLLLLGGVMHRRRAR